MADDQDVRRAIVWHSLAVLRERRRAAAAAFFLLQREEKKKETIVGPGGYYDSALRVTHGDAKRRHVGVGG